METENKLQCMESPTQKDNRKKKKNKKFKIIIGRFPENTQN